MGQSFESTVAGTAITQPRQASDQQLAMVAIGVILAAVISLAAWAAIAFDASSPGATIAGPQLAESDDYALRHAAAPQPLTLADDLATRHVVSPALTADDDFGTRHGSTGEPLTEQDDYGTRSR